MALKERFETFSAPGFFSRAEPDHILELYVGLDEKGRKSVELRASFSPRRVKGTSSIDVSQYDNQQYKTIRFSLVDNDISGLFYIFCNDLIEQTRNLTDKDSGYNVIVERFYQWKKLFVPSKKAFLSEPQIMGLMGELLFLKNYLVKAIGLSEALRSWSGQELTHKDFSYGDTWAEVKAISRSAQSVRISSLEQLDSKQDGILAVYSFEKMSAEYDGITLNKLVFEIRELFSNEDRDLFMSKVALQGYEYNNYYDDFVFELIYKKFFLVNNEFPKLTADCMPAAVVKASYDIEINKIADFEIKG